MSDYDILIKLDPSQPVLSARQIAEAIAKVEAQNKKSQDAINDALKGTAKAFDSVAEAIRREQVMLDQINGPAKRYEQNLQTLDSLLRRGAISTDQYANEVRKLNASLDGTGSKVDKIADGVNKLNFKQAAAGAAQAWSLLSQKIHATDSDVGQVVDSAVRFGAMGAQVAGPWGAAVGAIGGGLLELGDKLDTFTSKAIRIVEAKQMMDAWNASIAYGASEVHRLTSGLDAMHKALDGLASVRVIAAVDNARQDANRVRAFYGANLGGAAGGAFEKAQFQEEQAPKPKQWFNDTELKQLTNDLVALLEAEQLAADEAERLSLAFSLKPDSGVADAAKQIGDVAQQMRDLSDAVKAAGEADALKKWNAHLDKIREGNDVILNQEKQIATTLGDAMVDAANGADVSWRTTLKNLLIGFEKAIEQALILNALTGSVSGGRGVSGNYGGLFGLLGFASGGVISPSGSGTTDTQTVMFRKAPSETVRIHTPGQEAAYRGGGGGSPVTVQVVDQRSDRALAPSRSDHQLFVELARQNSGFLRGLTR